MELVYIALFAIWSYLCYYIGKRLEKAKQDEKGLNDIRNAYDARNNADIDELRKKYKRDSV